MDLFTEIKKKIEERDRKILIKQLGYYSSKKGDHALNEFMKHDTLLSWCRHGFYDMKYPSKELFEKLAELFSIDQETVKEAYNEAEEYSRELERCDDAYILAKFAEGSVNITSMGVAMGLSWKHSNVPPEFLAYKDLNTILNDISAVIVKHYRSAKENERFHVDDVESYEYHHYDGTVYQYTVNGELVLD